MAEYHRKIELQSPDDLQYLITNIRRAAHSKIDKDLPRIEGEPEDAMRVRVEEIIHAYINSVISTAAQNITINGLDPSPELLGSIMDVGDGNELVQEEFEPFDSRLFERAKELARQEEDLVEEIARLRRTVPGGLKEAQVREFREGVERDEEVLRVVDEKIVGMDKGGADLGIYKLERQEEVERGWERGVKGLGSLMRTMPEMVAKKERAERAEEYLVAGGRSY